MIALAPVTLTGSAQTVSLPSGYFPTAVRVANESPYACQVGLAGAAWWLNPWTADVFGVPQPIGQISIIPQLLTSLGPPAPSSVLLITLALGGERIPGVYPMNLDRQSSTWTPWQAPNLAPIQINNIVTGGVGNRILLLAGLSGQTIYMFACSIAFDAAPGASGVFLDNGDPNAGGPSFATFNGAVQAPAPQSYFGAPLTLGNGLYLHSELNCTIRGTAVVSQAPAKM